MSKKKRKVTILEQKIVVQKKDFQNWKYIHYLMVLILFMIISLSFFKIAFLNFAPDAGDTNQWRTSSEVLFEYNKIHKDQALWNSNIFSGMPSSFENILPKPIPGQNFECFFHFSYEDILFLQKG